MTRKAKRRWSWRRLAAFFRSTLTLAAWRWRQQWFLLLTAGIGVALAIALVGSLPLFSSVMSTAGLRNILRAQSKSAQIVATTGLAGMSSQLASQATAQMTAQVRQDMGVYLKDAPQVEISTEPWSIMGGGPAMELYGAPIHTAGPHLQLLKGRLPVDSGSRIEILLTPSAAAYL